MAADLTFPQKYTPVPDYPIQPKRHPEVHLKDAFWEPRVRTNREETIPFEVRKLTGPGSRRGLAGGVLEAAILSLQTHPDACLQMHTDAAFEPMTQNPAPGNRHFEVAAPYH